MGVGMFSVVHIGIQLGKGKRGPYSEKLKSAIPGASDFILQAGRAIRG